MTESDPTHTDAEAERRHTPGPWRVDPPNEQTPHIWVVAPTNSGVCKIECCDYDDGAGHRLTPEDYANARLIAAAPELADALRGLVADVADYEAWRRPCHALDVARAALAKLEAGHE